MNNLKPLFSAAMLSWGILISSITAADDTEIFFSHETVDQTLKSNVLLMFDTSGSMDDPSSIPSTGETRLDAVRQATIDLVNSTDNVNIGIGAFAGAGVGGSILYPVSDLNEDVCENAGCDTVFTSHRIDESGNDAQQLHTGEIIKDAESLSLGTSAPQSDSNQDYYTVVGSDSDAEEIEDGTLLLDNDVHSLFYHVDGNRSHVGYRFDQVSIPPGAEVLEARIEFYSANGSAIGNTGALINIDATAKSPVFADIAGQKISDRTSLTAPIEWSSIPSHNAEGLLSETPDIANLINAKIAQADWASGDAMTFMLEPLPGLTISADHLREFHSGIAEPKAKLQISYSILDRVENTVAMRFNNVRIPRGATVKSAKLRMIGYSDNRNPGELTIAAEAIGDSPPISDTDFNLTSRIPTAAVTWYPENYEADGEYTVDIDPIMYEIVNRSDWCGGNAITLLVNGSGQRSIRAFDTRPWLQPELELSYDPATVDFNDTCLSSRTSLSIGSSSDDAIENMTTGAVSVFDQSLATIDTGDRNLIGLKFNGLNLPQNATIVRAQLKFESDGFLGVAGDATIYGDNTGNSTLFDASTPFSISSRSPTVSINWENIDQKAAGNAVQTPDLTPIVQEILSNADWVAGNSLSIIIQPTSVGTKYFLGAFDSDERAPPKLLIEYQRDETTLLGNPVILRTARDEIIDVVMNLPARGGTPLVDYMYEAGLYFRGGPVHFGKTRGTGRYDDVASRVSHERSYTGGTLFQPPGCSEIDLNNVACLAEEIEGSPIYQGPESSSCLANNIVLLTDGAAQRNNAKSLVQGLPGIDSCANKSNADEECGVELAKWLFETDHDPSQVGQQAIKVHTIGFSFSSDFLKDVAFNGGGQFHTVENTNALTEAFQDIVEEAADINSSFVAPTVPISQLSSFSNSSEIYYSMFKPQVSAKWDGNLKRYSLGTVDGETQVIDALGAAAVDPATGAISANAQSYWSGTKDGAVVADGGAASQLTLSRNIQTFLPGTTDLVSFHETNLDITEAILGVIDNEARTQVMQWARGVDVLDTDSDGNTTEVRTQMGDPLHSAPFVIHYADGTDTRSMIYVATNEGYLHAIDADDGTEEYAIIPPELLPNLDVYFKNEPVESKSRPYGLDGDVVGWTEDLNGNRLVDTDEKSYVVVGMRRGGHNYYAFNVSDPENPSVAWVIRNTDTDFAELGETWSRPIKTMLKVDGVETHVLIFSGGYDNVNDIRDVRNDSSLADSHGRAIFIVDAKTGALLNRFDGLDDSNMRYSIPSTPRVIDINFDGLADYLFVGDTGGQLWRLDFDNLTTASLDTRVTGGVIAELSSIGTDANRRFYYEPDVAVLTDENNKRYLNIAIGSGWRANPLNQTVEDRMYVLRDTAIFGPPKDANGVISYTSIAESNLYDATSADTSSDSTGNSENGYYITMQEPGEKILSTGFTANSNLLFTSYLPQENVEGDCKASVGSSYFYAIDARNAKPILNLDGSADETDLTLSDRRVKLRTPGIAPSPSVLIPTGDAPAIVVVGLEEPEGTKEFDIGKSFKRTFWAEPLGLND